MIGETERLVFRETNAEDAADIYELYNDPDFIRNVGDRGIHSLDDAKNYIEKNMVGSYRKNGFGLWATFEKESGRFLGVNGLVSRPELDMPDLGFGYLPIARGKGVATEAAAFALQLAHGKLGFKHLCAIVSDHNVPSKRVLEKVGFAFSSMRTVYDDEPPICFFEWRAEE